MNRGNTLARRGVNMEMYNINSLCYEAAAGFANCFVGINGDEIVESDRRDCVVQ